MHRGYGSIRSKSTIATLAILVVTQLIFLPVHAANYIHDEINRRDPITSIEKQTAAATGIINCGGFIASGFSFVTGGDAGYSLILTSGHVFKSASSGKFYENCSYQIHETLVDIDLTMRGAGDLKQKSSKLRFEREWGFSYFEGYESWSVLVLSDKTSTEIMDLIASGQVQIKLYSRNHNPSEGAPRIQVSDHCTILKPSKSSNIFGTKKVIYHTCDETGSSSGGALVAEYKNGRVEVIGINFGAASTPGTTSKLLGPGQSMKDIEDSIAIVPTTRTISNVAIPLLKDIIPQSLVRQFNDLDKYARSKR